MAGGSAMSGQGDASEAAVANRDVRSGNELANRLMIPSTEGARQPAGPLLPWRPRWFRWPWFAGLELQHFSCQVHAARADAGSAGGQARGRLGGGPAAERTPGVGVHERTLREVACHPLQ